MAEESIRPRGPEVEDIRMAIIASNIANANRDVKRHPKPFSYEQFMPFRERPRMTDDQMKAVAMSLAGVKF